MHFLARREMARNDGGAASVNRTPLRSANGLLTFLARKKKQRELNDRDKCSIGAGYFRICGPMAVAALQNEEIRFISPNWSLKGG